MKRLIQRRWPALTVLVVALACFLSPIGWGDLEADAPIYAWMGRRMLATGQYLQPYYDWDGREPYFFKPPGQFWLSTIPYRLLGYTIPAARLAPALLWVAAALVLYRLVRLQHPRAVAATAAVALCAQRELIMNAMEVRLDGGMVLSQLLAGYGAARLMTGPVRRRWFALIGGACGLGLMLRGGPTLLCLPAILITLAWGRRWSVLRDWRGWGIALLAGMAVAGPWYGYECLTWGGQFLSDLGRNAIGRNLENDAGLSILTVLFYYARRIAESCWLWLLPAVAGGWVLIARSCRGRRLGAIDRLAVASLAVYFVLIHFSTQRNIRYAIPLFPWLGVVAATGLFGLPPVAKAWRRILPFAGPIAVGLGVMVIIFGAPKVPDRGAALVRAAPVVRAGLGLTNAGSLRSGRPPSEAVVWLAGGPGVGPDELNDQKRCAIQFYTGARCEVAELSELATAPPGQFLVLFTGGSEEGLPEALKSATLIDQNKRWLIYKMPD